MQRNARNAKNSKSRSALFAITCKFANRLLNRESSSDRNLKTIKFKSKYKKYKMPIANLNRRALWVRPGEADHNAHAYNVVTFIAAAGEESL